MTFLIILKCYRHCLRSEALLFAYSPRRCCWTPAASWAASSWATCRPGWADAKRRAGRTRRPRWTTGRCRVRRPPASSAALCLARRRPRRPRPSLATRGHRPPTARRCCCHSDHRLQTSGPTNTADVKNNATLLLSPHGITVVVVAREQEENAAITNSITIKIQPLKMGFINVLCIDQRTAGSRDSGTEVPRTRRTPKKYLSTPNKY